MGIQYKTVTNRSPRANLIKMEKEEKHVDTFDGDNSGKDEVDFSSRNLSNIRNKKRRKELYLQLRKEQSKTKSKLKKAKKKLVEEKGTLS